MNYRIMIVAALAGMTSAYAGEWDSDCEVFGFRISAGYQVGVNVKSTLKTRMSMGGTSKDEAYARATGEDGTYYSDDGGFIVKDDGRTANGHTREWMLKNPSSYGGSTTEFLLQNYYNDGATFASSDETVMHGAHIDVAMTVARDGDWGLDLFAGFSWMTGIDCLSSSGSAIANSGYWGTPVSLDYGLDALDQWYPNGASDGYGDGGAWSDYSPTLNTANIGDATDVAFKEKVSFRSEGEYDEYDIYGGLRLWYADEDLKWFKVTATIGAGVDYGDFEYTMTAAGKNGFKKSASFSQNDWDFYGLLGLGVQFDVGDFDLSVDGLWRYGQDALEIDRDGVKGEIERPDFIFRSSLGYHF